MLTDSLSTSMSVRKYCIFDTACLLEPNEALSLRKTRLWILWISSGQLLWETCRYKNVLEVEQHKTLQQPILCRHCFWHVTSCTSFTNPSTELNTIFQNSDTRTDTRCRKIKDKTENKRPGIRHKLETFSVSVASWDLYCDTWLVCSVV